MLRVLVVLWLCCAGCAWAQKPGREPRGPGPLQLEVSTPSQPAVRFDTQGRAAPDSLADPTPPPRLEAVEGRPMPYQSVEREIPWWFGPEIPIGPGRAWPTYYPAYGSPYGPAWPGPRGPWGGWGGFGPYW